MAHYIDTFPGREIVVNNKKHLYFGGTAYLGLQTDEVFQQLFIENIIKYGTSYSASRKSNIRLSIFNKAEAHLTSLVECESCMTLSSGYLAGQLISRYFYTSEHALFYAPNAHSALLQSNNTSFNTYASLNSAVRVHLASKNSTPVVLLDSIDFSGTNYPDFKALTSLPLDKIILVVDDSHGIGIVGENGKGVFKKLLALCPKELIVCCSLGKGFGIQAGAIFGTKERIKIFKNTPLFGGASPATPAGIATLLSSDKIYAEKRKVLFQNLNLFIENLNPIASFTFMESHPTFSYSNDGLTKHLEAKKILVTNFNYPSEETSLMSRIVLSAAHQHQDIKRVTTCINSFLSV
ncbi:MAG: 8-amino-7-oxononanoate synthase [Flavobacteriaceae bacterium]|nr:MAG: 8-amino-7-oxononanoate synthase [Flavobacteriaceae bacterium]